MRRPNTPQLLGWILIVGTWACDEATVPCRIAAASSLAPAGEDLTALLSAHQMGAARLEFGPSSRLARQLEQGAPGDVLITASPEWMQYATQADLTEAHLVAELASNRLVVAVQPSSDVVPDNLDSMTGRLAVASETAPLGAYSDAAIASIATALPARIIRAPSASATVRLLLAGEVDAAILYASDAEAHDLRIAFPIPNESHPTIRYSIAPIRGSVVGREAARILAEHGPGVLARYGFRPPVAR